MSRWIIWRTASLLPSMQNVTIPGLTPPHSPDDRPDAAGLARRTAVTRKWRLRPP